METEKTRARRKANRAVAAGTLARQPCERCGAEPAEMHHEDYSRPLDVRWLCRTHHLEEHAPMQDSHDARDPLICLRIPPGLDARLRADVEARGETISEVVRGLLHAHYLVDDPERKAKPAKPAKRRTAPQGCTHRVRPGAYCKRCERVV